MTTDYPPTGGGLAGGDPFSGPVTPATAVTPAAPVSPAAPLTPTVSTPPVSTPPVSTPPASTPPASTTGPTASDVKDEAVSVASDATNAAKDVASTAKDEARVVAHEVKGQAKDLYRQTAAELKEQAATQQARVAEGLRTVGDQLDSMTVGAEPGVASDLVGQASTRVTSVAEWLDARDPGSLLTEVRQFAARKPGTFIAIAALSGVLVGRLTRSLVEDANDEADDASGPKHIVEEPS